jgi:hypothetical protein
MMDGDEREAFDGMAGETGVFRANVAQCRIVHQRSLITCPGWNPGGQGGKPETTPLGSGTFCT